MSYTSSLRHLSPRNHLNITYLLTFQCFLQTLLIRRDKNLTIYIIQGTVLSTGSFRVKSICQVGVLK